MVGVAVLLAAAVLVDSRPPARPIQGVDRSTHAVGGAATLRR
jgi:hypothetical protein